ncbi:MAG: LysM domain-containing protein [Crocinitomicaceae bacterium]|nr:LysM domain-containing protein [Crocinitomicaceae bacterium]
MNEENLYTIKQGDTFWDLENEWSIPYGTLQELNPGLDPRMLHIGQKIEIVMPTMVYMVAEKLPPEPILPPYRSLTCRNVDQNLFESRIDKVYVHRPHQLRSVGPHNQTLSEAKKNQGFPYQSIHKGLSYASGIVDLENIRRTKLITSNELWHLQKNGTVTHPWKKMKNGASHWKNNIVKGHRAAFQTASKGKAIAAGTMKYAGKVLLVADIGLSGEIKPSHAVNIFFIGASTTGVGAIFAGIYFVSDVGTGLITGSSISDRLDGHVSENYGRLELYEGVY